MKYKVNFRIKIDGREVVDTIVVDAKNEDEAFKKVKEETLTRPKIISIQEMHSNKVQLTKHEKKIAKETFDQALKKIFKDILELHEKEVDEQEFSRSRIIVELAELFENEVETNY